MKSVRGQAEGAKNLWVRTGHQWKLTVGTYNVRSLLNDDRLIELDTDLENTQWDIIGISEVRRKGTKLATLRNGNLFYHVGMTIAKFWISCTQDLSRQCH